jgi:hypothetical protein
MGGRGGGGEREEGERGRSVCGFGLVSSLFLRSRRDLQSFLAGTSKEPVENEKIPGCSV